MLANQGRKVRALGLLSGGLDSRLACILLREQGVEVHGIVFRSPFFDDARAREAARTLGLPLHVVDFSADIVNILRNPVHGFGGCMNPCIDCHARMLKRAGELAEELGFDVVFTGEVLGQRPMSQNRRSLAIVAKESGCQHMVLRPLSALLLPETEPERRGLIDRSRLLGIRGRSRKPQLQMAGRYGLKDFPTPAGGCRLTEPNFCARLRDLRDHEGFTGVHALTLLRYGRHFRLADGVKLILGRNEKENAIIEDSAELYDLVLKHERLPGPSGLMPMASTDEQVRLGAGICAAYCDGTGDRPARISVRSSSGLTTLEVVPLSAEDAAAYRVG
jgi:hypothetical protein